MLAASAGSAPILPVVVSGPFTPLLFAEWMLGQYQMMDSWTIELWLVISGATWLVLSGGKQLSKLTVARPRENAPRVTRPQTKVPLPVTRTAQDMVAELTHEEWRARVFGQRITAGSAQFPSAKIVSKTG